MRREFSVATKKAAWARSEGRCECGCGQPFTAADPPEYHHDLEDALGGEPTLERCKVLRRSCHRGLTSARAPVIAKALRLERKARGITAKKRKILGSKGTGLRKKLNGTVWKE